MRNFQIETKILSALRQLKLSATLTELVAVTGLPRNIVEEHLPLIIKERRGHFQVKESGELVYTFPKGLSNVDSGLGTKFRNFIFQLANFILAALTFLFKIWIVVMLVGYFIIFITITVLLILAVSFGVLSSKSNERSSNSRNNNWGFSILNLILRFAIDLWFYSNLLGLKDNQPRKKENTSPFHQAVFRFVFGTKDVVKPWEEEAKKKLIRYISLQKGVITLDEIQLFLGVNREEANKFFSYLLINFKGEVKVSDQGTLYGWFPEILRTMKVVEKQEYPSTIPKQPFSGNRPKIQPWIIGFNIVNLLFGMMFLTFNGNPESSIIYIIPVFTMSVLENLTMSMDLTNQIMYLGLGVVPVSFSVLFFLIPLFRAIYLYFYNQKIEIRNTQINLLREIYKSPQKFTIRNDKEKKIILDFCDQRKIEVNSTSGEMTFSIPDLHLDKSELKKIRQNIKLEEYELGVTIFDSNS